jgi:hypothetical protein
MTPAGVAGAKNTKLATGAEESGDRRLEVGDRRLEAGGWGLEACLRMSRIPGLMGGLRRILKAPNERKRWG